MSPNEDELQQHHRRPNQYLPPPPPPPHSGSPHNMSLPPFQQTFYASSSYHSPPAHGANGPGTGAPGSGGMHHHMSNGGGGGGPPHPGSGGYSNHSMMPPPGNLPYAYPVVSPAMSAPPLPSSAMPRQAPPHSYTESPRMTGGYSSSPGFHHLSPMSPTNHLVAPGIHASSGSTSSSSYQSARAGMNVLMRDGSNKRRSGSDEGQSQESWDEDQHEKGLPGGQPWGMPQDEYKALTPRDKKQVRNRIGARRFRAKRKGMSAFSSLCLHHPYCASSAPYSTIGKHEGREADTRRLRVDARNHTETTRRRVFGTSQSARIESERDKRPKGSIGITSDPKPTPGTGACSDISPGARDGIERFEYRRRAGVDGSRGGIGLSGERG